ncbi:MAG: hypothetical protein IKP58_06285 [Victivallales bacterium]|nr:hypothetical protein [Victivallales bacterium]
MTIETKTLAYLQHILLNALCKDRTPSEVLRQYLKCGYDKYTLTSNFYSYDIRFRHAPCAPISLLPHPFVTACVHGNIPVVRLFLLLGANPKYCLMEGKQSPLEAFQGNPEMYAVLSEDTPMLARRFSKELAMVMKGQVEKCLLKGNYGQLFIYGMQGLKVTDSNIVFSWRFRNSPTLIQAFVFRMLMTPRRRKAIVNKIIRTNGSDAVPPVLRRAVESDGSKGREKLDKLLAMVNLLPEETMRMMAHSLLTVEEKISFVGEIMEKSNDARESRNLWSLIEELANGIYNAMWEDFCNHASQYNAIP